MIRHSTLALALVAMIPLSCGPEGEPPVEEAPLEEAPAEETSEPRTYEGVGTIVEIREESLVLDHEAIPGFMEAMSMAYPVADPDILAGLEEGMVVRFHVAVDGQSYVVERIEEAERAQN